MRVTVWTIGGREPGLPALRDWLLARPPSVEVAEDGDALVVTVWQRSAVVELVRAILAWRRRIGPAAPPVRLAAGGREVEFDTAEESEADAIVDELYPPGLEEATPTTGAPQGASAGASVSWGERDEGPVFGAPPPGPPFPDDDDD